MILGSGAYWLNKVLWQLDIGNIINVNFYLNETNLKCNAVETCQKSLKAAEE